MADFLVTNATDIDGEAIDIVVRDGTIERKVKTGEVDVDAFESERHYDANGRLVTPTLTEPHTHLDAALTAGTPRWNETGTLAEGWQIWEELREETTKEDIKDRAAQTIRWFVANGVTRVRTHVDTTYPELTGVTALVELKEELADIVDLQLVAFPMSGLFSAAGDQNEDLLKESLEMGVDVVGGIPHNEPTREDGVKEVETVVDIAKQYGRPLDLHIDETDDPQSRFTGVLASKARKLGVGDRTTASHATAMHSYSNSYANKLISLISDSGMSVVTNPPVNAVLQGRYDDYPRRRGHTRVDELREADVAVGIGQDDVMDGWFHYGDGDPLTATFILLHFAHMHGRDAVPELWEMTTEANAEIFGEKDYGLHEGAEGSLVVYDSTTPFDTLRVRPARTLVLKEGEPVARTEPSTTEVYQGDEEFDVDFHR